MPLGNAGSRAGGMLNDLKSRLGFSHEEDRHDIDDFDEYDDFDDDGFNARDDKEYAGYGADYDASEPVGVGGFKPMTPRSNRFGRPDSSPDLVTINDVKANTRVPDELLRDPLASGEEGRSSRRVGGRELVANSGPAQSSPAYNAAARSRAAQSRSEGLDSLFEPTGSGSAYDPYDAYAGTGSTSFTARRKLTVVRPTSYGDVEQVSRSLKAGDVVVLAMKLTPDALSKRVLDFSFGVASALDASVECPAEKVFAIARGTALTDAEKGDLNAQGVL